MRKNKEKTHGYQNYWGYLLLLTGILTAIVIISGYLLKRGDEETISAHPTSTITLDSGGVNEFVIEMDSVGKVEDALSSDYIQNEKYFYRFKKLYINAYAEQYYDRNKLYSQTYIESITSISDKYNVVLVFGYGYGTQFGGNSLVLTDKEGNIMKDDSGNMRLIRSSPVHTGNAVGSAHGAGPSKIVQKANGNFVMYTGPFTEGKLYSLEFDAEFNVVSPLAAIEPDNGNFPAMFQGGYIEGTTVYIQEALFNENNYGYIIEYDGETNTILNRISYEIIAPTLVGIGASASESNLEFGARGYEKKYMDTEDGGRIGAVTLRQRSGATFDQVVVAKWDADNKLEYWALGPKAQYAGTSFTPVLAISDENYFYYWINGNRDATSKLMRINLKDPGTMDANKQITPEEIMEMPAETTLQFQRETATNTYFYQGYVSSVTDNLKKVGVTTPGVIIGQVDDDFQFISGQTIESNGLTWFTTFDFDVDNPKEIEVSGSTRSSNFMDQEFQTYYAGSTYNNLRQFAFWGKLEAFKNHSPGIKINDRIDINVDDFATDTAFDQEMLSHVSATDIFDLEQGYSQADIEARINRNPYSMTDAIDWLTLGFDKTKVGPQEVTFFVTDSTNLQTATSTMVNATTQQTIVDPEFALDVQNFAVSLTDVSTTITDSEGFKKLIKSLAWDMANHDVDEEAETSLFSSKVTVNQAQLTALKHATEAKPYPVDVTYQGDSSITIVNRVWVFVTTKNTVVNKDTGIVIYGDDYTLPLYMAKDETKANVYLKGNIRVYDYYDHTHETDADCVIIDGKPELPTLADKDTASNLTVTNMTVITDASEPDTVQPTITYTTDNGDVTAAAIDVTITANVLFHVRQVVAPANAELLVPSAGYIQLENHTDRVMNIQVLSGEETGSVVTEPEYKSVVVPLDAANGHETITLAVVVPEYYSYLGYQVSDSQLPLHQSSTLSGTGMYHYNLAGGVYEKWLTVYIKGDVQKPGQYSWDYRENDLGTVVTE